MILIERIIKGKSVWTFIVFIINGHKRSFNKDLNSVIYIFLNNDNM